MDATEAEREETTCLKFLPASCLYTLMWQHAGLQKWNKRGITLQRASVPSRETERRLQMDHDQ